MERLFDALRDEDQLPPSEVDIDRAIRSGRRRVRVRWLGAAAFVVVVAFLVPVLGLPGSSVGPAGPPPGPVEDFDPMSRVVTVAGVLDVSPISYVTARQWQRINLDVGENQFAWVTVYAQGRQASDGRAALRPEAGTPAEPIGGRPAYWVERGPDELLAWQWADGAWAYVTHQDPTTGGTDQDTMRRIALGVRVGAGEPVSMPFTLPLPEHYTLIGATTQVRSSSDPFVRTGLVFGPEDPADPDLPYDSLSVAVENGDKVARHLGANETVDGRPALVQDKQVIIFDVADGFAVDVQGTTDTDTLRSVARTVRLVPTPNDRSTWTIQPLT